MKNNVDFINSYRALALQVTCHAVNQVNSTEAHLIIQNTIQRLEKQIAASLAFIGNDCRLIVLPEYFLTGFPMGETIEEWREKACLKIGGFEYAELGKIAQKYNIFLAGNAYELDDNFPNLYFQTSFIIAPNSEVVLRYRRLNSMFAPTPHDVWDQYLECYGLEGVFPVAKTEIGNLAAIASEEILYPELVRCLTMRGAEILLHPTSEIYQRNITPKDAAKISRSVENIIYVISTNTAGIVNSYIPSASVDGGSKIIDYRGIVLAETGAGESMAAFAEINLAGLKGDRQRPGLNNLLSRQRFELYAQSYLNSQFYPPNTLTDGNIERKHFIQTQKQTIERLSNLGII